MFVHGITYRVLARRSEDKLLKCTQPHVPSSPLGLGRFLESGTKYLSTPLLCLCLCQVVRWGTYHLRLDIRLLSIQINVSDSGVIE